MAESKLVQPHSRLVPRFLRRGGPVRLRN